MDEHLQLSKEPPPAGLVSWQDCERFDAAAVRSIYEATVGRSQVRRSCSSAWPRRRSPRPRQHIVTDSGRRILDMSGGVGVLGLGHNHPRILAARAEFERRHRMEVHKAFLSKYLAGLTTHRPPAAGRPGRLVHVQLGAEAVEGPVKLAYKYHGGRRATSCTPTTPSTQAARQLGPDGVFRAALQVPDHPRIDTFAYDTIESVEAKVAALRRDGQSDIYAIILEPYCVNALRGCSEAFLRRLRRAVHARKKSS